MAQKVQRKDDNILNFGQMNTFHNVVVREFTPVDRVAVHQIFYEGIMEMIPDRAFRGLKYHPESLLLYFAATVLCFVMTMCWCVIAIIPAIVLCGRYFYTRQVVHGFLEQTMSKDMGDIEGFYMKPTGCCMWVAVLDGKVVGMVAAVGQQKSGGVVELQRMSVDRRFRRFGIGLALGRKLLDFAAAQGYVSVVLSTTSYRPAAHRLYKRLGFRCVETTNGYITPGARQSLLGKIFYRVRNHVYTLDVKDINISMISQH
ncbi:N-acetylaspartate synthetase-like [Echeneis naucrates]|uniref:N-acetylaspartate synthetase n=1 Tax=Echeneis naucrates TaxID=173247 RepID=A0A665WDJ8_ECHNA|nr:N-acetylaspartate synthetase-like [Echeneis naucrates]